jgi:hypothetical protein
MPNSKPIPCVTLLAIISPRDSLFIKAILLIVCTDITSVRNSNGDALGELLFFSDLSKVCGLFVINSGRDKGLLGLTRKNSAINGYIKGTD